MGYFNYFVKCIIRNISYKLCKTKVLLTILLSIIILFVLHSKGYCAWTDDDIAYVFDSFATITQNQGVIITQLGDLGVDVSDLERQLTEINTDLDTLKNIETYSQWTVSNLESLNTKIGSLAIQIDAIAKSNSNIETYSEWQLQVLESINNKLDTITSSILEKQDAIKEEVELGNQLQEQNNQIQQEQNNFLKQEQNDNDVSIDSFNNVDSNDITSSGLTGIFNTIYNSINSWSSKDINFPVPFTDKSINIQANYTSNMLNRVGRSDFN